MPRCRYCSNLYKPARSMQPGRVCNDPECQAKYALETIDKQRKKRQAAERIAAKEDRKTIRIKREQLKTRGELIQEAQREFNTFIRERDRLAGHRCISSGRVLDWSGNNVDAGHYRSTGSAPHLRFDERNCHAQNKQDNRYLAGNAVDYRIGLIARIGLAEVEALEADQTPRKWTREELISIRNAYRQKLKELQNAKKC